MTGIKALSQHQIDTYNEKGFLLVKGLVDSETAGRIKTETEGLHEAFAGKGGYPGAVGITWEDLPEGEAPRIRQLMGSQNVSRTIREIGESPELIGAIEQLLGAEADLFHSKLLMKAALSGSFTPWHSDWGYWRFGFTSPTQMNAFLAIDPSTLENGCIRYVPGSHREFIEHSTFENTSGFAIGLPGGLDAFDAEPLEMEPGDVAFHGSITLHASDANRSTQSRVMNTFAYITRGTVMDDDKSRAGFRAQRLAFDRVLSLDEIRRGAV